MGSGDVLYDSVEESVCVCDECEGSKDVFVVSECVCLVCDESLC